MIKFGTGGWRAIIGDDFTKENVRLVAQAMCDYMFEQNRTDKPVMIGYDRRFLSKQSATWIAEVFSGNGIKSLFMTRTAPTPLVMFTVKNDNLYYGVEVTASHNPAEYNGIKFFIEEGRDADVETTKRIETLIATAKPKSIDFEVACEKGLITYLKGPFNAFIDSILSKIDVDSIRDADLRILFDSMHGSATHPMLTMLHSARCTVDTMNSNKDGYFGGNMPAPSYEQSALLRHRVATEGYDLGIEVDGDGDRLAIIDANGEYIEANKILAMLYYYLHEYKGWKGPVVRNLMTTHMLDAIAKDFGETCYEVPVGFKHISSMLDRTDAVLGGESSGGLTVRGHIFGKDSVYAAGLFVEMVARIGKSLSEFYLELTKKYGEYYTAEDSFKFSEQDKARIQKLLLEDKFIPEFKDKKVSKVGYFDGVKYYFEDGGYLCCRFSGTEPLLRLAAETDDMAKSKELLETLKKTLF